MLFLLHPMQRMLTLNESHLFSQVRHRVYALFHHAQTALNESHLFSQVRLRTYQFHPSSPCALNESHLFSQVRPESTYTPFP